MARAPGWAARTDRRLQTPRRNREFANVPFYSASDAFTKSQVASAPLWSRDQSSRTVPAQWGNFHNSGEARVDGRQSGADPYHWPSVRHIPKDPGGASPPSASPHGRPARSRDLGDLLALMQGGVRAPKPIPLSGHKAVGSVLDEWRHHKQEVLTGPHQRTTSAHQPWRTKDVGFSFGNSARDIRPWLDQRDTWPRSGSPSPVGSRGLNSSPRPSSAEPSGGASFKGGPWRAEARAFRSARSAEGARRPS